MGREKRSKFANDAKTTADLASSLAQKAAKTYVDEEIAKKVSGSPKGVYATLTVLQTAFPTGTTGIYIVSADGKWYYWSGSAWTAGGTYQSTGISSNSIDLVKLNGELQNILLGDYETKSSNGKVSQLANYLKGTVVNYTADGTTTKIYSYRKNILDPSRLIGSNGNITKTINGNTIAVTNTNTYAAEMWWLVYLVAGTYTLSYSDGFGVGFRKQDNTYLYGIAAGLNKTTTFTVATSDIYKVSFSVDASTTKSMVELQLELASAKTSWSEPKTVEYNVGDTVYASDTLMVNGANIDVSYVTTATKTITGANPLYGKKLSINGDSIAYGAGATGGFGKYIAENNSMTLQNIAVSGATITANVDDGSGGIKPCISTTVTNMDSTADYVILEGSVNDYSLIDLVNDYGTYSMNGYSTTLNTDTFLGAFEYMLRTAVTKFVGKKILYVFVHGIYQMNTTYYITWRVDMINLLNKYGVPYLELDKMIPPLCNIPDLKTMYTNNADGWHPNELGYKTFYVSQIEEKMKTL
jgi:hypothetical protein